jgi:hypothetical protein
MCGGALEARHALADRGGHDGPFDDPGDGVIRDRLGTQAALPIDRAKRRPARDARRGQPSAIRPCPACLGVLAEWNGDRFAMFLLGRPAKLLCGLPAGRVTEGSTWGVGVPLRKAWTWPARATNSIDSPGRKTLASSQVVHGTRSDPSFWALQIMVAVSALRRAEGAGIGSTIDIAQFFQLSVLPDMTKGQGSQLFCEISAGGVTPL